MHQTSRFHLDNAHTVCWSTSISVVAVMVMVFVLVLAGGVMVFTLEIR